MALVYQGATLHDAGCACCSFSFSDAKFSARDPTGTKVIRRAMAGEMALRFNALRKLLREQIVNNDLLGLNFRSVMSSVMASALAGGGANKVEMFQRFIDTALNNVVLEHSGEYLKTYIEAAFRKGEAFGIAQAIDAGYLTPEAQRLASVVASHQFNDRIATLQNLTFVELQGVCEAVSQQCVRVVTDGILARNHPNRILRALFARIQAIGVVRSRTIADFVTVRAYNEASLDVYAQIGVEDVGLIPETRPPRPTTDAAIDDAKRKAPRRGAGSRVSRTKTPSRSTIQRIRRQEAEVEKLGLVKVRTAGDDDVCPICLAIAKKGPYKINRARQLIPAHPNCRCVFVPARDKRFKKD
jgi:hypothetical protein